MRLFEGQAVAARELPAEYLESPFGAGRPLSLVEEDAARRHRLYLERRIGPLG